MTGAQRLLADAARAARGAGDRLTAAADDLFLADEYRPSDRQRAIMSRLLKQVVGDIEADLRADLLAYWGDDAPIAVAAALGTVRMEIAVPILTRAGVLRDVDLVRLLLVRAEEHRIVSGLRRMSAVDPDGISQTAPAFDATDPEGAALEMAVLIAESRRFDGAQDPVLHGRDLPADIRHRLLWRIAAALREYVVGVHAVKPATADMVISRAVMRNLATHDEGESLDAATAQLARYRESRGQYSDAALQTMLRSGRLALFVATLAVRAGIDQQDAFLMVSDPRMDRLTILLRAVDVGRDTAVSIVSHLAHVNGISETHLTDLIDGFSALTLDTAGEALRCWQLDPGYRAAIGEIEAGLAGR